MVKGWCCLVTLLVYMLFVQILTISNDLPLLFRAEEQEEKRFSNQGRWFWIDVWSDLLFVLVFWEFL